MVLLSGKSPSLDKVSQLVTGIQIVFQPIITPKISLLTSYVLVHNFDIIYLPETCLNSKTSTDDQNLEISGYSVLCTDHPSNNKRGVVCIFYRTTLPLRVLNISYLSEYITSEISIGNKVCRFIHHYRSPSQAQDEF